MTNCKIFRSNTVDEHFKKSTFEDFDSIFSFNDSLIQSLLYWKNQIDHKKNWDILKKFTNKYELIFSISREGVADFNPISRSYFKLIEILTDFQFYRTQEIKCACICEGPGGFVQAINDYATINKIPLKPIECISLLSSDKKVPDWKLGSTTNYKIGYGSDGTGDIYKIHNIDHFCNSTGSHSCDVVTADGGFDFSQDFNSQEKSFLKMFFAEMYTCVRLQKNDGICIIKCFDLFRKETIYIIAILLKLYANVDFIKPNSSRPANSEKYVVCSGFRCDVLLIQKIRDLFIRESYQFESIISEFEFQKARRFVSLYNLTFVQKQIQNIRDTLEITQNSFDPELKNEQHREACIEWCNKYKIPIKKK